MDRPTAGSSGSGEISSRYFAIGTKNKNLSGRSGIGVLVVVGLVGWGIEKTCPVHL